MGSWCKHDYGEEAVLDYVIVFSPHMVDPVKKCPEANLSMGSVFSYIPSRSTRGCASLVTSSFISFVILNTIIQAHLYTQFMCRIISAECILTILLIIALGLHVHIKDDMRITYNVLNERVMMSSDEGVYLFRWVCIWQGYQRRYYYHFLFFQYEMIA